MKFHCEGKLVRETLVSDDDDNFSQLFEFIFGQSIEFISVLNLVQNDKNFKP